MSREEFLEKSPLRVLERYIHGGPGTGKLGALAARKGVGKTACLVQIALDRLWQQKSVIHVSFARRVDYIIQWYEDIFREISTSLSLESGAELYQELIKNRVIMNFNQAGTKTDQVLRSLEAMILHGKIGVETIIVDGYNFANTSTGEFYKFRDFARRMNQEVWFSASLKAEEPLFNDQGLPRELEPFVNGIDILLTMRYREDKVRLHVVKDNDFPPAGEIELGLDPETLLMASL